MINSRISIIRNSIMNWFVSTYQLSDPFWDLRPDPFTAASRNSNTNPNTNNSNDNNNNTNENSSHNYDNDNNTNKNNNIIINA